MTWFKSFVVLLQLSVCSWVIMTSTALPVPQLGKLKTGTSSSCNNFGCTKKNYAAVGDLRLKPNDVIPVASTFGAKTDAHWTRLGGGASADAYLAHVVAGNSWSGMELNVGKVGAGAYAGVGGVGAMASATLGEAGGKIGSGPWSIGGKVGLSANTGFRIGPKTEVKVLGSGFSLGYENGLEGCLYGSCVSVG